MLDSILNLTESLIRIPSVRGQEQQVIEFMRGEFESDGWPVELIPLSDGREDIFAAFGEPRIIFTTHLDVVPAPEELFQPRWIGDRLYGRGACDAKGIAATMIGVAKELLSQQKSNFGVLLVLGEETDGQGALAAAGRLAKRNIRYLVNGEPTTGKVYTAQKGLVAARASFSGRSAHSGYPELGEDANRKLIKAAYNLTNTDFGHDEALGAATVNIGKLQGGVAGNVISAGSELAVWVRTVTDNESVIEKIKALCSEASGFELQFNDPLLRLLSIPGLPSGTASFGTDIPCFQALEAEAVLYGPGDIRRAHTDEEFIEKGEIERAFKDYLLIFDYLSSKLG